MWEFHNMRLTIIFLFISISHITFADIPISTIEELQNIGNDPAYPLDGSYYLTNDIDASDTKYWNGGKGFEPISLNNVEGFSGILDGKEFIIENLYINRPDTDKSGVFSYVKSAKIINIKFTNLHVIGGNRTGGLISEGSGRKVDGEWIGTELTNVSLQDVTIVGSDWAGGLVNLLEYSNLNKCHVNGDISANLYSAGLVLSSDGVVFNNCSALTNISAENCYGITTYSAFVYQSYTGGMLTGKNCGGLIGNNFNGIVQNCFSNCNINANEQGGVSGGLIRENQWKVKNSYATGKISGEGNLKGLIAVWGWYFPDPPEVTDSFYDYQTTGQYDDNFRHYGVPKTTLKMMNPATFENWDFENVWWMVPGKTYPLLQPERYIDVSLKPAEWMPEPKYGFPLEYEIVFGEEMSDRFTFNDIDFTSSTLESPVGTLTTENGTTWTLMITDTASTPTWPADLVIRVPIAGATNLANYPCAESNATSITIQAPAIPGDFNGDGVCDETDKIILGEMIIDPSSPWRRRLPLAKTDLNEDNILDAADVVAILPLMNKSR